jgi:hypothetical protein
VLPLGLGSRSAIATIASLLSAFVVLSLATGAEASVKTFSPVAKTRKALVFKIDGVDPTSIRKASATLRHRDGRVRRKNLSACKMQRAAERGKLTLRRGPTQAKGSKVKVVLNDPPPDGGGTTDSAEPTVGDGTDTTSPDGSPPGTGITGDPPPDSSTGSDGVYTVPASVPSGCTTDATSEILAWIASVPDGATLRFGAGACYRIEGTIELQGRTLTIDGNGSTFKALDPPSSHSAIWRAWDSSVTFRDMTIVGSYADGGVHNFDLQWAHGIDLRGTHGVVENVSMSDLAGDCVYFGLGEGRSSGAVRDSSCRRIGRNAVSVTAGDDITVERVTTDRIGFIAFDVEPDPEAGNGSSRVVFDSNTIGSYYLYAWALVGNAPIADQAFTNNRVVGKGLRIAALYPTYRPQRLTVTGNSSDTNQGAPAMQFNGVDDLTVSGNTVPLTSGAMASVKNSCDVNVSGNSFPGGSQES